MDRMDSMLSRNAIISCAGLVILLAWVLHREALLAAVAFNVKSSIPYLLAKGYDVNGGNILGWPLLHIAVMNNNMDIADMLIAGGADLDAVDNMAYAAINVAVARSDLTAVKLLLSRGASVAPELGLPYTPLFTAVYAGNPDTINLLVDNGADVNARALRMVTPLSECLLSNCSLKVVQALVQRGADMQAVDEAGRGVLHHCVAFSSVEVTRFLVAAGAPLDDPDEEGKTPLFYAAGLNDDRGWTMLRIFQENGALLSTRVTKVVHEVRLHSSNPEIFDEMGWTALHYAAFVGNINAVKYLLAEGAEVDARNEHGLTPLLLSFVPSKGLTNEVAVELIAAGADICAATTKKKWTALHMAAGNNDLVVARLILDHHQNSGLGSVVTVDGDSALDWAISIGHTQMTAFLSSRGVVTGKDGKVK